MRVYICLLIRRGVHSRENAHSRMVSVKNIETRFSYLLAVCMKLHNYKERKVPSKLTQFVFDPYLVGFPVVCQADDRLMTPLNLKKKEINSDTNTLLHRFL